MPSASSHRKIALLVAVFLAAACTGAWLYYSLRPANAAGTQQQFTVAAGAGFRGIAAELQAAGLIRSARAFEVYTVITGQALHLNPGEYQFSPAQSANSISAQIASGPPQTTVTIPEGDDAAQIDSILSQAGVTQPGAFLALVQSQNLEGQIFPDTYKFYLNSTPQQVLQKFLDDFNTKAEPLLANDPNAKRDLILASLLEKEVPGTQDQEIVAGILIKRVAGGVQLDVDSTICYAKQQLYPNQPCYPITSIDKKIKSPYNTYLHYGWPPGPIGNPGTGAIMAALHPQQSPYWYYLSDPVTGKTIYATTLDEQAANQLKYLNKN